MQHKSRNKASTCQKLSKTLNSMLHPFDVAQSFSLFGSHALSMNSRPSHTTFTKEPSDWQMPQEGRQEEGRPDKVIEPFALCSESRASALG